MRRLQESPPPYLTDAIMGEIRAERGKTARRLRMIRRFGALAAAAVIVPTMVLLAPIFLHSTDTLSMDDDAFAVGVKNATEATDGAVMPIEDESARYSASSVPPVEPSTEADTTATATEILTDAVFGQAAPAENSEDSTADSASGSDTAANEVTNSPKYEATSPVETDVVSQDSGSSGSTSGTLAPAPDYVGAKEQPNDRTSSGITTMGNGDITIPQSEAAYLTVFRALLGDEVLEALLADWTMTEDVLPRYLLENSAVTRADFVAQADELHLSFTDEELDAIFG